MDYATEENSFSDMLADLFKQLVFLYICWVCLVITLAALGKTFYVRYLFVKVLILIFEVSILV